MSLIEVKNLNVIVNNEQILHNVSFTIKKGETNVIMGPNGAGKSTISNVIMGNPKYKVMSGKIYFNGEDITDASPEQRAKMGLFMSFQQPPSIPGVTVANFLRTSYNSIKQKNLKTGEFFKLLKEEMKFLNMESSFRARSLNVGFSGGEKKKLELLQLLLFKPQLAILDEIDSGLDIDALKLVVKTINNIRKDSDLTLLIITHHNKLLSFIPADKVIVLKEGSVLKEGNQELSNQILDSGFENLK